MSTDTPSAAASHARPSLEARLRAIIEKQPASLIRVGADGALLAANEAALSLLGADRPEQILETSLVDLVAAEDQPLCVQFLARAVGGQRGSCEVHVATLTGLHPIMLLEGVPLAYGDDVPSLLCTLVNVTEQRRLERELVSAAARADEVVASHALEYERLNLQLQVMREQEASRAEGDEGSRQLELELRDAAARYDAAMRDHGDEQARLLAQLDEARQQLDAAAARHADLVVELEGGVQRAEQRAHEAQAALAVLQDVVVAAGARERELLDEHDTTVARHEDLVRELEEGAELAEQRAREAEAALAQLREAVAAGGTRERELLERHAAEKVQLEQARSDADAARSALARGLVSAVLERSGAQAELVRSRQMVETTQATLSQAGDLVAMLHGILADTPTADGGLQRAGVSAGGESLAAARAAERAAGVSLGAAVRELEPVLRSMLSPGIALDVIHGSDALVPATRGEVEALLLALIANRRASMIDGGQVTIELADVELDDACAGEQGARAGAFVLLSVHASGPGVAGAGPFETPSAGTAWEPAGPGFALVLQLATQAGGHLWAVKEGDDTVAFEAYLPRLAREASAQESGEVTDSTATADGGDRAESRGHSDW